MSLHLVTAPTARPVSLIEAKAHLRVEDATDDGYIDSLIEAATAWLDGESGILGRALVEQTWDLRLPCFEDEIVLPLPPWRSTTSVKYIDDDGTETTVSSSVYETVDGGSAPSFIRPRYDQSWPVHRDQSDAVRIRFVAGYASAGANGALTGTIPRPILLAILEQVGTWFAHRETVIPGVSIGRVPDAAAQMLGSYKVSWF